MIVDPPWILPKPSLYYTFFSGTLLIVGHPMKIPLAIRSTHWHRDTTLCLKTSWQSRTTELHGTLEGEVSTTDLAHHIVRFAWQEVAVSSSLVSSRAISSSRCDTVSPVFETSDATQGIPCHSTEPLLSFPRAHAAYCSTESQRSGLLLEHSIVTSGSGFCQVSVWRWLCGRHSNNGYCCHC